MVISYFKFPLEDYFPSVAATRVIHNAYLFHDFKKEKEFKDKQIPSRWRNYIFPSEVQEVHFYRNPLDFLSFSEFFAYDGLKTRRYRFSKDESEVESIWREYG